MQKLKNLSVFHLVDYNNSLYILISSYMFLSLQNIHQIGES